MSHCLEKFRRTPNSALPVTIMSSSSFSSLKDLSFRYEEKVVNVDSDKEQLETAYFKPSGPSRFVKYSKIIFKIFSVYLLIHLGYLFYQSKTTHYSTFSFQSSYFDDDDEFSIPILSKKYLDVLETSNQAGEWSKVYTEKPHLAGTNYELVEFTAAKFAEYGFRSSVEPFNVYINYPKAHGLKLLSKKHHLNSTFWKTIYEPTLVEDELDKDPTTVGDDLIPAFHGYSANGNVTAKYIFANYGTKEDFELLKKNNVEIAGNIVIVRYGKIFRGLKVQFAQENGAVGVLIYTDPADDGVAEGAAYPDGPGRNPSSIQRGSVQFLSTLPGDPSRFTDRSIESLRNLTSIPKIPSLPVSSLEIEPILKKLNGFGVDLGFEGGLKKFKYSTGPISSTSNSSDYKLNIYNDNDYNFTDIYNVYGIVEGEEKDKVIMIGNHRDAWIKGGAGDPNSGSATLLEIARAFNELFKLGYKPRYSIMLSSWDGEEYALLGSTAYAEKYAASLGKELIAYINLDAAVTGTQLNLHSSPLLNEFLLDIAKQVQYPDSTLDLNQHFKDTHKDGKIGILGSGSDYTAFFEHLGITSVDIGFGPGKNDAVYHYHSNYDSYYWMETFGDPGFKFHNTLAKYIGLIIINLSEHKTLDSFDAYTYSSEIKGYFDDLVKRIPKEWLYKSVEVEDESLSFNDLRMMDQQPLFQTSNFTLSKLIKQTNKEINSFIRVSKNYNGYLVSLQYQWDSHVSKSKNPFERFYFNKRLNAANRKLIDLEKNFLYEKGLNGRPWFKHVGFASGRYTGYAGQALPGLTEAVEDLDFDQTCRWIGIIKKTTTKSLVTLV